MSAIALGQEWLGYRVIAKEMPDGVALLVTESIIYMSPAVMAINFRGQADETHLVPDFDAPRDAAPEGWR